MISPYQFWIDLGQLLFSPKQLVFGFFDLVFSWLYTRSWWSALFGLPLILLAILMIGSSLYNNWIGPTKLLESYWRAVEQESQYSTLIRSEKAEKVADSKSRVQENLEKTELKSKEELSPFASSLLLKIIYLSSSDTRANYLVAAALGNQGRNAQARQVMRRIAPENERGFPPAHAWLAADTLQSQGVKDQRELVVLMWDLAQAKRWPAVEPLLMSAYADLLMRENKVDEAVSILRESGKEDSRLLIRLAGIAKQQDNQPLFQSLQLELEAPRLKRVQDGTATELDFVELSSLQLLENQIEKAIEIAQVGQIKYAASAQLKRLLSTAYMMSFEEVSKKGADGATLLGILELAMRSDPSNPKVLEKIADLIAKGNVTDERGTEFLREQLAAGKANALAHLLLAISHLKKEELDKAIVHLEVAQGLAPTNPVILNNLALCIARTRPNELPKAKKMMEVAITVAGANAELLDSYGEILVLSKDYIGAIRAFEAALSINQDRLETRKKLSEAYTAVALEDMAESVKKGIVPKEQLLQQKGIYKFDDILKPANVKAQEAKDAAPNEDKATRD